MFFDRLLILAAGLCGAAGVAFSAVAAHDAGGNLGTAANFLLVHAPVFLAIGLAGRLLLLRVGSGVLLLGVALFCGDLLMRHYAGTGLFPFAAPSGGMLMIGGWCLVGISAFVGRGR